MEKQEKFILVLLGFVAGHKGFPILLHLTYLSVVVGAFLIGHFVR